MFLRYPPAAETEARLLRTALLVCLAIVNLLITVRPFVDRFKSFVPFVQQLEEHVSPAIPLYAYRPDETTLGVVNFYTGRRLSEVVLEQLQTMARERTEISLIVRDSKQDRRQLRRNRQGRNPPPVTRGANSR